MSARAQRLRQTRLGAFSVHTLALIAVFGWASALVLVADARAGERASNRGPLGNQPPVADAGGPYTGIVGFPVALDGSSSSDPDGDPLTFTWEIEGLGVVHGATADFVFPATGPFDIRLIVNDGVESDTAQTMATIAGEHGAVAYVTGGDKTIRLKSGKNEWCLRFESADGAFKLSDVDLTTIRLNYPGPTESPSIPANNVHDARDADHDGVPELEACFLKSELRELFDDLVGTGRTNVNVVVTGALLSGPTFQAALDVDVDGGNARLAATALLAPDGGIAALDVASASGSAIEARVYDLRGRLVRRAQVPGVEGGVLRVALGAGEGGGARLVPGVYFYLVEQDLERVTGRFLIFR